jgi:hypothetical protein
MNNESYLQTKSGYNHGLKPSQIIYYAHHKIKSMTKQYFFSGQVASCGTEVQIKHSSGTYLKYELKYFKY